MTITESVVELADSAIESAVSIADFTADPPKIGVWVWAFTGSGNVQGNICM